MWRKLKIVNDERGMTLISAGAGIMAFMGATMLAIDVGMMMSARSQAQNAADAGALAGAMALYFDDWNNRTSSGPAVQNAITAATSAANHVMGDPASVRADDVTFPEVDRVSVTVHRTSERDNPLLPWIAPLFNIDEVDVRATAIARVAPANGIQCVMPFAIPDKWIENQTGPWDPDDTFEAYYNGGRNKGERMPDADVYIPPGSDGYTGYSPLPPPEGDRGTQLVLKAGTGSNLAPSFYFPWAIPGNMGADDFEQSIAFCNQYRLRLRDGGLPLTPEPGAMDGPTRHGIEQLIASDPAARWDEINNRPIVTVHPTRRIVGIPVFNPEIWDEGKQNSRNADVVSVNVIGFFIEGFRGNDVVGRITPITGTLSEGPAPEGVFPAAIVLVR
jgi:hypothetical protein